MQELQIIDLMLPAAAECLVLVGIHSYLGLHVIRRRVIFVDLALAQIAALGTAVGFMLGMAPDSMAAWIFSVLATLLGALLFTVTRVRHERIPHEAFIGIIYAVAAAAIVLLVEIAPQQGADSIGKVLTGAILYVKWESIGFAAVMYSLVGLVHWVFRKQFVLISDHPEEARKRGMNLYLWDFLFYLTFGVVISISVRTAGVLLVFVFLVAPAIFAAMITDKLRHQIVIGWTMGVIVTVLGLFTSYQLDVPSGPAVVTLYGIVLAVGMAILYLVRATNRKQAFTRVGLGTAAIAATALVLIGLGRSMSGTALAGSDSHHDHSHHFVETDEGLVSAHDAPHDAHHLADALGSASYDEQIALIAEYTHDTQIMTEIAGLVTDGSVKIAIAQAIVEKDQAGATTILLDVLTDSPLPFVKSEALSELSRISGQEFSYDLEADEAANQDAVKEMQDWIDGIADDTAE